MVWIDQREVAKQNLADAESAVERIRADGGVSRDILVALESLLAASKAFAQLTGASDDEDKGGKASRSSGV
ncbi:MAG: hypothetical protein R2717_04280 [Schumannella sp.]|nr:hypothetical protein [Microbacteriaceae bacterium]